MDYLTLKSQHMKKMKQVLEKKDTNNLKFLLALEKGRRPFNPKRKPHRIIGRKIVSKTRSKARSRSRSGTKKSNRKTKSISKTRNSKKTKNPLLF